MKQFSAAIIGTGRIGFSLGLDKKREQPASHSAALKSNRNIRIIAGVDTHMGRLKTWHSAHPQAKIFDNAQEFFATTKPDIITIAVNEDAHLRICLDAIQAQPRLIILEKPVALNLKESAQIESLSLKCGVPILINHERRFSFDYLKVRDLLASNAIGALESVYATLSSSLVVFDKNKLNSGHYSLIHDGTHIIDILHFLLGTTLGVPTHMNIGLSSISTNATETTEPNCLSSNKSEAVNYLQSVFSVQSRGNQTSVILEFSGRRKYFGFDIELRGTQGQIRIGNGYLEMYRAKSSPYYTGFKSLALERNIKRPRKTGYFANMVQNAVDFLQDKAPLGSTLQDGINALEVIKQIENKINAI